jgi:hypothetical protein
VGDGNSSTIPNQKKKKKNQPNNQTYFALSGVQKTELGYKAQICRVIGRGKHVTEEEKKKVITSLGCNLCQNLHHFQFS